MGWIFDRELYSVTPTTFLHNFDQQATTLTLTLALDFLNPKISDFDRLLRTTMPCFKLFQSGVFILSC